MAPPRGALSWERTAPQPRRGHSLAIQPCPPHLAAARVASRKWRVSRPAGLRLPIRPWRALRSAPRFSTRGAARTHRAMPERALPAHRVPRHSGLHPGKTTDTGGRSSVEQGWCRGQRGQHWHHLPRAADASHRIVPLRSSRLTRNRCPGSCRRSSFSIPCSSTTLNISTSPIFNRTRPGESSAW